MANRDEHPKSFGRYAVVRVIGEGSMGVVYEGHDPQLDRRVAIKTVMVGAAAPASLADYQRRFANEARSAARMLHPNIAAIYDFGQQDALDYIVMEYVDGVDLKTRLLSGPGLSLRDSLRLVGELLAALGYMHARGVVHRDVKPANLMLQQGSGQLKVTDFGIAKFTRADSGDATRTGLVGTPHYMAPEQVECRDIDGRADVFSAGVILYQLVCGCLPFDGPTSFAVLKKIVSDEMPAMTGCKATVSELLTPILQRALAKDPQARFPSAEAFAAELFQLSLRLQSSDAGSTILMIEAPPDSSLARMLAPSRSGSSRRGGRSASRRGQAGEHAAAFAPAAALAGYGSGGIMGSGGVALELELRLWEEIRQSADAEDFEQFLQRFPDGAFAAQARKRLQRLRFDPHGSQRLDLAQLSSTGAIGPDVIEQARALAASGGGAAAAAAPAVLPSADTQAVPAFDNEATLRAWRARYAGSELRLRDRLEREAYERIERGLADGSMAPFKHPAIDSRALTRTDLCRQVVFADHAELGTAALDDTLAEVALLMDDHGATIVDSPESRASYFRRLKNTISGFGVDNLRVVREQSHLISARFELMLTQWEARHDEQPLFTYNKVFLWQLGDHGWRIVVAAPTDYFARQRSALLGQPEEPPLFSAELLDRMTLRFFNEYQATLRRGQTMLREPFFQRPFLLTCPRESAALLRLDEARLPYAGISKELKAHDFRWYALADWLRLLVVDYRSTELAPATRLYRAGYLLKFSGDGIRIVALIGLDDAEGVPAL